MKIYGIKNCDTVRKTLKFLDNKNITYQFIDFRQSPLNISDIEFFIEKIGLDKLINRRSTTWKQLNEEDKTNINTKLILENPTLMKRPIVIKENSYFVGFDKQLLTS